jgi:hypothetical protein
MVNPFAAGDYSSPRSSLLNPLVQQLHGDLCPFRMLHSETPQRARQRTRAYVEREARRRRPRAPTLDSGARLS